MKFIIKTSVLLFLYLVIINLNKSIAQNSGNRFKSTDYGSYRAVRYDTKLDWGRIDKTRLGIGFLIICGAVSGLCFWMLKVNKEKIQKQDKEKNGNYF